MKHTCGNVKLNEGKAKYRVRSALCFFNLEGMRFVSARIFVRNGGDRYNVEEFSSCVETAEMEEDAGKPSATDEAGKYGK